ncbi:3' terminal RNA ribose 2'-O-methyltransferase Hen1 [Paenibacillus sp. PK4536]|uniref:3' terminal RNA ribose 2'-O-methyltransferase Hen1 n=1 Tax=Paenibacillus sp. PK4536 TaxID=3024576 RepID=UPI002359B0EC|nr:3' terminal RNA ribose 2'-O-methyltransferase Hen1 [Paenibacillus sp. PK4536]WIM41190.1 3' terminal RNA ribose 2'-O-methyltransferase Hen1 [Paenibacillus sp. PK4536]
MYLTIKATGTHASMISHLLAKNPNNLYDRTEKGARIRLVYTSFQPEETEVLLFVTPDPIDLVKGSPDHYDITQYINDRELVVSSLFCSYIRPALGTALNGKPKADYIDWVEHPFTLHMSMGPVASDLPDSMIESLFQPLGYEVQMERGEIDYSFDLKNRSTVRHIQISGQQTLQHMLRQLYILIPVLDNYKHYYISDDEIERLQRYGEGWLSTHPQHDLIIKRSLRFAPLIKEYEQKVAKNEDITNVSTELSTHQAEASEMKSELSEDQDKQYDSNQTEPPVIRLNELRYRAIVEQVSQLPQHKQIVDFGAGEGKLSVRLGEIEGVEQIWAVEPSMQSQLRAIDRFAKLEGRTDYVIPVVTTGSLFYRDERWVDQDVIILCEVIEHINEVRLPQVIHTLFTDYRPQTLIMTTPNREYNEVYQMGKDEIRHTDHRFEWTRAELEQYCTQWIQDRPYTFTLSGIGEKHEQYGQPTQMVVFHRIGGQHL